MVLEVLENWRFCWVCVFVYVYYEEWIGAGDGVAEGTRWFLLAITQENVIKIL